MALEAHSKARINTILSKVRAQRFLVEKYLSGDLDVGSEAEHEAEGGQDATRGNAPSQRCRLTPSQTKLMEEILVGVQNAMVAASATSDEEPQLCRLNVVQYTLHHMISFHVCCPWHAGTVGAENLRI